MKRINITINAIEETLTVSKSFYKKASAYGTAEYTELRSAMLENPGMKIIFKSVEKKTYGGLTFKKMKEYIETQADSAKMLIKFEAVQRVAKAKGSLYPLTKKWFLKTFPEYKVNEVSDAEAKEVTAEIASMVKAEAEKEISALLSDSTGTLSEVA